MSAMAMAMAMAVSSPASPSPPTLLSLLNRQRRSSISCIHLPSLSRSSPQSLSHTFNPLRYTLPPFSSQSLSLFLLSHFAFPISGPSSVKASPNPIPVTETQRFESFATLPLLSLLPISNGSLPFPHCPCTSFTSSIALFIYLLFIIYLEIEFNIALINNIIFILVILLLRWLMTEKNVLSNNYFFLSDRWLIFQTELFVLAGGNVSCV